VLALPDRVNVKAFARMTGFRNRPSRQRWPSRLRGCLCRMRAPDVPGGIANDRHTCRHIAHDNGTRADDASLAYLHAGQDNGPGADNHIVSDLIIAFSPDIRTFRWIKSSGPRSMSMLRTASVTLSPIAIPLRPKMNTLGLMEGRAPTLAFFGNLTLSSFPCAVHPSDQTEF